VKPWELPRYTYREVLITLYGATQNEAPIRRAAYLIHCSLVNEKHRIKINKEWPLPYDVGFDDVQTTKDRLLKKQEQLKNAGS
jgi:hypothetical protein